MDNLFKKSQVQATHVLPWGSLLLTIASSAMLLQTPTIHANSLMADDTPPVSQEQLTVFYIQPQFQADHNGSWQDVPGIKPVKITGIPGDSYAVPAVKNFLPLINTSIVPKTGMDSDYPLKLKYRQANTGQYTATVNIYYTKKQGSTIYSDTKTLHYADTVTIFPKQFAGYKLADSVVPMQYFSKNSDQSVSFTFKELRDSTYTVKFLYLPVVPDETGPAVRGIEKVNVAQKPGDPQNLEPTEETITTSDSQKRNGSHSQNTLPVYSQADRADSNKLEAGNTKQSSEEPMTVETKANGVQKDSFDKITTKSMNVEPANERSAGKMKPTTLPGLNRGVDNPLPVVRDITKTTSVPKSQSMLPREPDIVTKETSKSQNSVAKESVPHVHSRVAVEGMAVYAINKVGIYKFPNFKESSRMYSYSKQKRHARPMFVVIGYARSNTGKLRYQVRDVNHLSSFAGQTGYLTADWQYVRPAYYTSRHLKIKVVNPTGIHAYTHKNLTGKQRSYRIGRILSVKRIVHYHLTTRFVLTDGSYVSANRKLVKTIK